MVSVSNKTVAELFARYLSDADVYAAKALAKVSAKITKKRVLLKMNQQNFAKYMDVSQSMVSKWESGDYNFTIETIADICAKLDLTFEIKIEDKLMEYKSSDFSLNEHKSNDSKGQEVIPIAA